MFKTFKQFIGEDGPMPAPNAGGPMAAPSASPVTPAAPTTTSGASSALMQQSSNLGMQIQQTNQKLQKLMQQKATIDKQIGQANNSANAQASANQSTVAATQAAPGQ